MEEVFLKYIDLRGGTLFKISSLSLKKLVVVRGLIKQNTLDLDPVTPV
jgi:hypothetical protein